MPPQKPLWKKGRGKLGVITPLLGSWVAEKGMTASHYALWEWEG